MDFINQKVERIDQDWTLDGILKQIEIAARICYQSSSGKLTSKEFVDGLIKKGHLSPLGHGTVYLKIPVKKVTPFYLTILKGDIWTKIMQVNNNVYITTNYRRLYECDALKWLKYLCPPTQYHELRETFKVTTSIAISRELNRHATALSICESSTRYCNYSKEKFGHKINFIKPYWYDNASEYEKLLLESGLKTAESTYLKLIDEGCKAQEARAILPLETATTVIYTGFSSDWDRICKLRGAEGAHPECQEIAKLIQKSN